MFVITDPATKWEALRLILEFVWPYPVAMVVTIWTYKRTLHWLRGQSPRADQGLQVKEGLLEP